MLTPEHWDKIVRVILIIQAEANKALPKSKQIPPGDNEFVFETMRQNWTDLGNEAWVDDFLDEKESAIEDEQIAEVESNLVKMKERKAERAAKKGKAKPAAPKP